MKTGTKKENQFVQLLSDKGSLDITLMLGLGFAISEKLIWREKKIKKHYQR